MKTLSEEIAILIENNIKICTGCGSLNAGPLPEKENGEKYLSCCPDNNYVEVKEYWKNSFTKPRRSDLIKFYEYLQRHDQHLSPSGMSHITRMVDNFLTHF